MGRQIWVDGMPADRLPERSAAELLRFARQMVVRHRRDADLFPFWVRVLNSVKERRGSDAADC